MSSLQKSLFKENSGLSKTLSMGDISEEESRDSLGELPQTLSNTRDRNDYSPIPWEDYFPISLDIGIPGTDDVFRTYEIPANNPNSPIFVFHHGAGYSGLSFALCAKKTHELLNGDCCMFTYDCRGHGATHTSDETTWSLERLSQDVVDVVTNYFGGMEELKSRDIFLIGHSMGGSVVAEVASKCLLPSVMCIALLDVVEGYAVEALAAMASYLSTRPTDFDSLERGIKWSVKSRTIRNRQSARISFPSTLREVGHDTGKTKYVFRADLAASQPFWEGWFSGLSGKFLLARAAKLLILAGTDRLDTPLTIAQMQGKYQLVVMPEVGHQLQEDDPEKTAQTLVDFWKRNERLVLPPRTLTI
ncbi:5447_t:CDS:2 [Paraglomus occultum]|uniref:Protein phosphatase methylesterase 1 n=1 Tax=Paraglomus occultum TaxID=144539 RepID=A0A9N9BV00_9GLOM|nr:5447_t:CDS:2 [Paraglomus occultum]